MLQGGRITGVFSKLSGSAAAATVAWVGDVHKIAAASANTDGTGTTIFGTKPTIAIGDRYQSYGVPSTTTFAVGDYFAFFTDTAGAPAPAVTVTLEVLYASS
jgi:hypothetical protein